MSEDGLQDGNRLLSDLIHSGAPLPEIADVFMHLLFRIMTTGRLLRKREKEEFDRYSWEGVCGGLFLLFKWAGELASVEGGNEDFSNHMIETYQDQILVFKDTEYGTSLAGLSPMPPRDE